MKGRCGHGRPLITWEYRTVRMDQKHGKKIAEIRGHAKTDLIAGDGEKEKRDLKKRFVSILND